MVRRRAAAVLGSSLLAAAVCAATLAATGGPATGARRGSCAAAGRRVAAAVGFARGRYRLEARGSAVRAAAALVAGDRALTGALRSGDLRAARAEALSLVVGHHHVTAIRVRRGGRVVVETHRYPFDVAGAGAGLRAADGVAVGTVEVTIQDVIGFIRLVHKFTGSDVVVRGAGGARSTRPALLGARLPVGGCATVGGRTYAVGSFVETDFDGRALRISILRRT